MRSIRAMKPGAHDHGVSGFSRETEPIEDTHTLFIYINRINRIYIYIYIMYTLHIILSVNPMYSITRNEIYLNKERWQV